MSKLEGSMPTKILFVCAGNTCRSPMAQVIAQDLLASQGLSDVSTHSAGIIAYTGSGASRNAMAVVSRHGLDLSEHRSELLDEGLVAWAAVVIVMEAHHMDQVVHLGGNDKVITLKEDVPDPFGCNEEAYSEVFNLLRSHIQDILERVILGTDV